MISNWTEQCRAAGLMVEPQTQYALGPEYGIRAEMGEGFIRPEVVVECAIVDRRSRQPINVHRFDNFPAALAAYLELKDDPI